ncbi:Pfs and NB-ARC domain protein [Aspergillus fischeri NRRL 181]|uniref:Pfs and NB-ARC domain protein n=1 Tax=Neosartorya fischeri (strain ATCC 1020 / DSM 3700 / CBS 544.65 / FGSC A1164 / JCM 1740 / NRRL 181 / WB 181) TaxID=331117 RepID=A1DIW4_NEOFI|nr:Pfs and NB-ARC domain protein [Aspergillus fischeri NRRL 181]EAW19321.1 Pfs and NB-ARC domain protein [Aspergillus fischeri NRRL 181]
MRPRHRDEFDIAIICSLSCEAEAIEASLDEVYDRFGEIYDKVPEDRNVYINGRIGKHNVVLCQVPEPGKCSSASVASSLIFSYTGIQLALVVGICGGVPSPSCSEKEIFLGDIVIADSVIEFDVGEQCPWGFQRETSVKAVLERPNRAIRNLLDALSIDGNRALMETESAGFLKELQSRGGPKWQYPGASKDILFASAYQHQHRRRSVCINGGYEDTLCKDALEEECYIPGCAKQQVHRGRSSEESVKPALHIGMIASGDTVMESGEHRDRIAETEGVIAFETIGAGVWDTLPCVIINGVSDYADGRKNEVWQNYAAAVAASGAKAFLQYWAPSAKAKSQSVHSRVPVLQTAFIGREIEVNEMKEELGDPRLGRKGIVLWGLCGYGKTQLAIHYISVRRTLYDSILWIDCSSWGTLHDSFSQIWRKIQGCAHDEQSPIERVLEWLEQETNPIWIMVFDGVETTATSTSMDIDIRKYIPSCNHGHVLLTALSPCLHARLGYPGIQVRGVDEDAGAQILLRCAGVEEPDSPAVETARAISRKVGGLPLALEQAGSFLRCGLYSLQEYNRRFQEQFAKSTFKTPLHHCIGAYEKGHTLWTVFKKLYDAAGQRNPDSIKLLHLAVFLGPGLIPSSLIMYPPGDPNKYSVLFNSLSALESADTSWLKIINWWNSLRSRETDFANALQTLEDSGLVNFNRKRSDSMIESFEIDGMVQSFVRLKLSCHGLRDNAAVAFLFNGQYCAGIDAQSQLEIPQEHLRRLCTVLDDFMSLIPLEMIQPPDGKYFRLCGSVAPAYARVCRLKGDYETSKTFWVLALQFIILSQRAELPTSGAKLEGIDAAADALLAVDESSIEVAWKRACESIALSPAARARKGDFGSGALRHDPVAEPMPSTGLGRETSEGFTS